MIIIGTALEKLQKNYPKKAPRRIPRKLRRIIKRPPCERSRKDRTFILDFAIVLFDVLIPENILDDLVKSVEPTIRKRLLHVRILLLSLVMYNVCPEIKTYDSLLAEMRTYLRHRVPHGHHTLIAKSSFSYQLTRRSPRIFRKVFMHILSSIVESQVAQESVIHGQYRLRAIDYSVFNVVASLRKQFPPINQSRKAQCSMHTVIDALRRIIHTIKITSARDRETTHFKELFDATYTPDDTIWIADRGYWSYGIMNYIIEKKHHFVFRLAKQYHIRKILAVFHEQNTDMLVLLGKKDAPTHKKMSHPVRIVACPQENSEIYWYVTSLWNPHEFPAAEIRALYKKRWSIEILFRDIKHILTYTPISRNRNGVEIEFYGALITHTFINCVMLDSAHQENIPSETLSFKKTYEYVGRWIKENHVLLSDSSAPKEMLIHAYSALLKHIAQYCINEPTKKRLAKKRILYQNVA